MGGSKKASKPPPKKESKYKIPTAFNCPKCEGKRTIEIKLKRTLGMGYVYCNGDCGKVDVDDYDHALELEGRGAARRAGGPTGGKKRREQRPVAFYKILRLEEAVDVYFKYYEAHLAERRARNGEPEPEDELNPFGDDTDEESDNGLAIENDDDDDDNDNDNNDILE